MTNTANDRNAPGQRQLDPQPDEQSQVQDDFDVFEGQDTILDGEGGGEVATGEPTQTTDVESGSAILDRLRGLGIEADSEEGALETLAQRYQESTQYIRQLSDAQKQERRRAEQLTQLLMRREQGQQSQQPTQQPVQPQQPTSPWRRVEAMKIPPQVLEMYKDPDTGSLRPDTPMEVVQEASRYQREMEEWFHAAMQNPQEFFEPGIKAVVEEMLQERLQSHERQRDTRSQIQQINDEVYPYLYQVDPQTGAMNTTVYSEFGLQFADSMSQAKQLLQNQGKDPSREEVYQMAYWHMQPVLRYLQQQQQQPIQQQQAQQPAQPDQSIQPQGSEPNSLREQRRRQHMRQGRAAGGPQTAASATTPDNGRPRPVDPRLTIGEDFGKAYFGE